MPGLRRSGLAVAAVILLAVVVAVGCGSASDADAELTVYLSAPRTGPTAADAHDIAAGARTAITDAGSEAGGTPVRLEILDGPVRGSAAATAAANARTATEDSSAIAYIGEVDSGSTRTSLPITNEAGLLQVSASASAVDLTRAAPGSDQIPDEVQPSGSRTFGRVIPSDTAQGAAAGLWMKDSGEESVAVIGADGSYGESLVDGLESVIDGPALVAASGSPGAIFVASDRPDADILDTGGRTPIYGADAQITGGPPRTGLPPGSRLIAGAMAPGQLPGEPVGPGRFTAYGYEAMALVLDSIDRADDPLDRGSVIDSFFATTDRNSLLGTYSIDPTGDTTLARVGAYEAGSGGRLQPEPEALAVP